MNEATRNDPAAAKPAGDKQAEAIELTEQEEYLIRKRARASAVDDGDGAHGGGMGASGSAVDFGRPKNYSGVDDKGL